MVHAVIGPSGSGKSTLVSALLGLHKPQARGSIGFNSIKKQSCVLGKDLACTHWFLHVGYLSQQPFLFQGTVRDNLTLRVPGAVLNEDLVNC